MIRSSIIVILTICYCVGVLRIRAMASDGWPDREQPFLGPALDIRSESLYELVPKVQDVMGLRALWPDAAVAKVMSVRVYPGCDPGRPRGVWLPRYIAT